jgi:hypothetical protein
MKEGTASSKLTVRVEAFTPHRKNTLYGFANIVIPELHLRVNDLPVHEKHGKRWASLPSKPMLDRTGAVRKDEHGKPLYLPMLQFTDQATQAAFSQRVVASLLEFAPAAFDDEEAA